MKKEAKTSEELRELINERDWYFRHFHVSIFAVKQIGWEAKVMGPPSRVIEAQARLESIVSELRITCDLKT